jgi:hypothetical protein
MRRHCAPAQIGDHHTAELAGYGRPLFTKDLHESKVTSDQRYPCSSQILWPAARQTRCSAALRGTDSGVPELPLVA